jgi:hypothetical protein
VEQLLASVAADRRACAMIKRQNWAVSYGGGEYGSEDSSDSELEEAEKDALPPQATSLSWAESVAQSEQISSDDEDGVNDYANMALRGPIQTAAIGGFRGKSFERKPIVPSSEEESDGGISSDGDGEAARFAAKHHSNESKKEKLGRRQREARRLKARRARKSDLLAARAAAAAQSTAEGGEGQDDDGDGDDDDDSGDGSEDEEAQAREAKLRAKFERFKEHAEKCARYASAAGCQCANRRAATLESQLLRSRSSLIAHRVAGMCIRSRSPGITMAARCIVHRCSLT